MSVQTQEGNVMQEWPLVNSASTISIIFVTYLLAALNVGPRYMKSRKPKDLTGLMKVYNLFQVALSAYIVYLNLDAVQIFTSFKATPLYYHKYYLKSGLWLYFFSKLVDLADTAFMILRKKENQITFLHVYHHSVMIVCVAFFFRCYPGDYVGVYAFINSIVHTVMYSYYFLSSLGPKIQKYLWWKKYITRLQLAQFVIGMVYVCVVLATPQDMSKVPIVINGIQGVIFLFLFGNFYTKSYKKTSKK